MTKKKKNLKKSSPRPKTVQREQTPRNLLYLLGFIPVLLAFLLYFNTLGHQYTLDDYSAIKENYVTQQGMSGMKDIFTKHYRYGYWNSRGTLYRPLSLAMFAVEWAIAPDSPGLYHFMNVLLYALTGFLLFWTLYKLFPRYGPILPFLVSLLFISHPIHVEAVANIKSRDEILSLLFGLLTIYLFYKYLIKGKITWLLGALGAYTLAMFSKESAITYLAVFPLVAYYVLSQKRRGEIIKSALFLVPVALYMAARAKVLGGLIPPKGDLSRFDNVIAGASSMVEEKATALALMGKYLRNLVFPHPLGSDFGFNEFQVMGMGDWQVLLSLAVLLGIIYLAIKGFMERSPAGFGWLFFGITFSIVSNLVVIIGTSYGDRLMYIPSVGFLLALVYYLLQVVKTPKEQTPQNLGSFFTTNLIPLLIVGGIVVLFSIKTILRNPAWENSYELYRADIEGAPNSAKLNYHYGLELNKKGLAATTIEERNQWWDAAMKQYFKAVEIAPDYADVHNQFGLMYSRMNNMEQALKSYQQAIDLKPNSPKAYSNMGKIYFDQGNVAKAKEVYEAAVRLDPRYVDALRNLGAVYGLSKQFDQAIVYFQQAIQYSKQNGDQASLYIFLGNAYRDKGDLVNAQKNHEIAYRLNPALRPK